MQLANFLIILVSHFFSVLNMKLKMIDREEGLVLFGKLIRTKKIENLQGDEPRSGPEPTHPDSKQKLQVSLGSR